MQFGTNFTLDAKNLALASSFAACYVVSSFWTLFPVIGDYGKFITVASIIAPLIGMILGPFLGAAAVSIGGAIALFNGAYGIWSLAAGIASTFCSGLLFNQKRNICIISYLCLFTGFAFYPNYGPVWSFPLTVWMHIVAFALLVSPLTRLAAKNVYEPNDHAKNFLSVFIIAFVSVLYGHMAGSLVFEMVYFPLFAPLKEASNFSWKLVAFQYPIERLIMAFAATVIGVALIKALKKLSFL